MKAMISAVAAALLASACTGGHTAKKTAPASPTAQPPSSARASTGVSTSAATIASDSALILTMYDTINRAFQRKPDDGVRALIAAQDPQDAADVEFGRCVHLLSAGGKTLPPTKKYHFVPNIATTQPDPGYTVTSSFVKDLHPVGRIYVTDVTITDGGRPRVSPRHQVILNGKAYQFSSC